MSRPFTRIPSRLRLTAALLAVAAAGACGTPTTPGASPTESATTASPSPSPTPTATCSAAGMSAETQTGLPAPVASMRERIVAAASACDYEALAALAKDGGEHFTYSFGGDDDPAAFWREQDNLDWLVKVLNLPYAKDDYPGEGADEIYVWPSAFRDDATDEDWEAVAEIYSEQEIRQMKEFGGYIGYRVGILPDGDWIFFVAGD